MTTVVSPSGCGKSVLVESVTAAAAATTQQQEQAKVKSTTTTTTNNNHHTNLLIGMEKFDIQNRADPYQAIVEALTALIHQLRPIDDCSENCDKTFKLRWVKKRKFYSSSCQI
jgi:ABC-type dipeptide/oligopeptide/nickel transport system ATPase subunit